MRKILNEKWLRIVPPVDWCCKIPIGFFTDSIFEWAKDTESNWQVREIGKRCDKNYLVVPAPTMEEILQEMEVLGAQFRPNCICYETYHRDYPKNSIEALAMWLFMHKIWRAKRLNGRPITNADRLREMSDEELAVEITGIGNCNQDGLLKWLKEKVN